MIKDILNENEKVLFLNYFWDAFEKRQSKVSRNNRLTWTPENTGER